MKNIYISRIDGKVVLSPSILAFTVEVEDEFNMVKIIEVEDGIVQKTNEHGQLLYKINSFQNDEVGEVWSETTDSITITKYEEKEVTNKCVDNDGIEHSQNVIVQEPIEWINNEPVMIPNIIQKSITFLDSPTEFTALEVLNQKYNLVLDETPFDFIQAGIFLNEDKIDLTDIQANTGYAIMQLLPNGYAKTKVLTLNDTVDTFRLLELNCDDIELYINDVKFDDTKVITLEAPTNEIVLRFVNTTDKFVDVKSYAIAY